MGMGGRSHLAGAAGTGLSLRNEALAVLHLPALVVAVCRDQGPEGVSEGSGRFWGIQGNFEDLPELVPSQTGQHRPSGWKG